MREPTEVQPETARQRTRRILGHGENTDRTAFFADAVMAIALTVLVLEIRVPQVKHLADLPHALLVDDLNGLFGYLIAFVLIATNWMTHHRKFTVIERYDPALQILNFCFLFFIALLPLPVSIMAEYGPVPVSVALYAFFIAAPSIFQMLLWIHAWRAKLFSSVVDAGMYRVVLRSFFPVIVIFPLSILVNVFFGPQLAIGCWFLMAPAIIVVRHWPVREDRIAHRGIPQAAPSARE